MRGRHLRRRRDAHSDPCQSRDDQRHRHRGRRRERPTARPTTCIVTPQPHDRQPFHRHLTTGGYCNGANATAAGSRPVRSSDNPFADNVREGTTSSTTARPSLLVQYHAYPRHVRAQHDHRDQPRPRALRDGAEIRYRRSLRLAIAATTTDLRAVGVGAAKAEFDWMGHTYVGFSTYQAKTSEDAHNKMSASQAISANFGLVRLVPMTSMSSASSRRPQ